MKYSKDDRKLYEDSSRWENTTISSYFEEKINIFKKIIPSDIKTIIDIGCGNGIITNQLANSWNIIGFDRSLTALTFVQTPAICGSIENLPFCNNSFDLVLCSEVLEHLPEEIYQRALSELKRVAKKYLLITVPYGEYLPKNYIKCPKCSYTFNAAYHLRSFDKKSLPLLFPEFKLVKFFECGKKVRQYNPLLLSIKQKLGNSWARFSESKYYICPSCNFRFKYQQNNNLISFICDGLNRFISPRHFYWLGGLFKK
ncbi:MAG: class I SAM-dependent methyltransferase [Promethearchaeota archaeon]